MLKELEEAEDKWMTMREFLPLRMHRSYKDSFLNKTVLEVRVGIKRHLKRNKK